MTPSEIDERIRNLSPAKRELWDLMHQVPKAILDEVWRMSDLINQGVVPVCADPNMLQFAEFIAKAKGALAAKASHPFDPDKTNGVAL